MRIRSIKPEFWRSRDVAALDRDVRLLFVGMWSYVDDNGVGRDDVLAIVGDLFALEEDPVETRRWVSRSLETLEAHKLILRYVDGAGRPLLFVTGWDHHQRVQKPNKPRYRRPESTAGGDALMLFYDDLRTLSGDTPEVLRTGAGEQRSRGTEEQSNRGAGEGSARAGATRLSPGWTPSEALLAYAEEHAPSTRPLDEAEKFRDYWLASARSSAFKKDWDAAFRTWLRKAHEWNVKERGWVEPGKEWLYQ
jgi:hypothetical protein